MPTAAAAPWYRFVTATGTIRRRFSDRNDAARFAEEVGAEVVRLEPSPDGYGAQGKGLPDESCPETALPKAPTSETPVPSTKGKRSKKGG